MLLGCSITFDCSYWERETERLVSGPTKQVHRVRVEIPGSFEYKDAAYYLLCNINIIHKNLKRNQLFWELFAIIAHYSWENAWKSLMGIECVDLDCLLNLVCLPEHRVYSPAVAGVGRSGCLQRSWPGKKWETTPVNKA